MRHAYALLGFLFATEAITAEPSNITVNIKPTEPEEPLHPAENWTGGEKVILQGLDKISARVFTSEAFVNQKVHFGSLEIYVRSASKSPPEDQPESACFLEIFDNKSGQQRQKVFSGWMFSSNPALSALEHPVYDIWVKDVVVPAQPAEEAPADPAKLLETKEMVSTAAETKPEKPKEDEPVEEEPED